jgi:hypothetical protein
MRSRFFMGGRHVSQLSGKSLANRAIKVIAGRALPDPRDLLVHCAQEMNHLAGFLPELYSPCHSGQSFAPKLTCKIILGATFFVSESG